MSICRNCRDFKISNLSELGFCKKKHINIHELTSLLSCYEEREEELIKYETMVSILKDGIYEEDEEYIVLVDDKVFRLNLTDNSNIYLIEKYFKEKYQTENIKMLKFKEIRKIYITTA